MRETTTRFKIAAAATAFCMVACTAAAEEGREGVRKALQTVEDKTAQANRELGYIIGIAAMSPIVYTAALTWKIVSAPLTALNDTFDAASTVYKKLKKEPVEGAEEAVEAPSQSP